MDSAPTSLSAPRLLVPRVGSIRLLLLGSAVLTSATWLVFMLRVPAWRWSAETLPFQVIAQQQITVGLVTETMALLLLLLVAYALLAWAVWRSPTDLPVGIVVGTAALSSGFAALTYSLFAEDVYPLLANVWTLAVAGQNPYLVPPGNVPGNPFTPFTGYAGTPYVWGPVGLLVSGTLMRLLGPGVTLNLAATKVFMIAMLWLLGYLAWRIARLRGDAKPVAMAALVLWNPLLLTQGVMTPHLDLPMAGALLASLLLLAIGRDLGAVVLLVISVETKLITLLLVPALALGAFAAGLLSGPRRRRLLTAGALGAGLIVILWPMVWAPFLKSGMPASLDLVSSTALLPNLFAALAVIEPQPGDAYARSLELARQFRWVVFVPLYLGATALCVAVARRRQGQFPLEIFESLALVLLSYHVAFTLQVLPWHFITVLVLCLTASSRWALLAGLLITASGVLHDVNAQWVWIHPPGGDLRWVGWLSSITLLVGPLLAAGLLVYSAWRAVRSPLVPAPNALEAPVILK